MSISACPVWTQPCPFPLSSLHPSPPKVELLKCGKSVLETIKLVTEVQDPSRCLLLSVGALSSPIVSQIVGTLVLTLFLMGCLTQV